MKMLILFMTLMFFVFAPTLKADLPAVPTAPDEIIPLEKVKIYNYEVPPYVPASSVPNIPADAYALAVTEQGGKQVVAYNREDRFYVQETIPGKTPVRIVLRHLRYLEMVYSAFSPDGRFLVFHSYHSDGSEGGDYEPVLYIWEVATHRLMRIQHLEYLGMIGFYFVRGTNHLVTTDRGNAGIFNSRPGWLKIWDLNTGSLVNSFQFDARFYRDGNGIYAYPFDPLIIIRVDDDFIEFIDLTSGEVQQTYRTDDGNTIDRIAMTQDGAYLSVSTQASLTWIKLTGLTLRRMFHK